MTRIAGPTRAQLDQAADQYATLLDRELAHAIQRAVAWLGDQFDPDDLGVIPKFWAERLDDLLAPTLALALHAGSADVRRQLRRHLGHPGSDSSPSSEAAKSEPGLTAAAWNGIPVTSQQLADAYLATARNRLVGVGDLIWQLAREQLVEGQQAGESIAQLRDRVAFATGLAVPRAGQIAHDAVLDALNYGALAEMMATGLEGTKEWLSHYDARVRVQHEHADGQQVGVRSKFEVGGWAADRPHDPILPIELRAGCRCSLVFSVDLDDVSLEPAQPAQEQAQERAEERADHQVLGAVWVADALRRGVTADDLAALLSLGPFLPDQEPEAETAAAETFHLAGKHNQKTHGHSRKGGQISRAGMGDLALDDSQRREFIGGSAAAHLVKHPDGSYGFTPERQALHDKVVNDHLAGKTPVVDPTYNMLGGGPGSGKSTLVRQSPTLQDPNTVVINPDDIKDSLPEYRSTGGKNNTLFVHEESSYLGKRVQAAAFERRYNVTFDGVGNGSPPKLRGKVDAARAAGYRVNGQYVTIPTDLAIHRAELRGQQTGRYVPESIITELHTGVSASLPQTYQAFDSVDLFDNRGDGPLQHVMQWRDGTFTVHDPNLWDDFVAKGGG